MSEDKKNKKILDSDADGLFDSEEKSLGTNPNDKDTDHDGLDDYQEVNVYKTDPLTADTDHDQISDGLEIKMGRNPKGKGSLRDLFIPHDGNAYKPQALHPKRLVFHAISAIIIKVIMVVFALSLPVQAWLSPDILYQQAQKIIELTNNIRTELGISQLVENQVLSQAALNKAQDMLISQYFAHVGPDNRSLKNWLYDVNYNFKVAGENLAIGFSSANDVMDAWQNSPTHYSNIIDPEFTEIGVGVVSGEYNAYETTLIAQYFGNPYEISADTTPESIEPVEENAKKPDYNSKVNQAVENFEEIPIEFEEENILIPESNQDLVLAEKEGVLLEKPLLISPENKYLSQDNIHILNILAKGAQRVAIYNNGQAIAHKVPENEQFDIVINLEEGDNNIQIIAYQGSESVESSHYLITVDTIAPILDQNKTSILVNKPGDSDDFVLKVTAYLSDETTEAFVNFADQRVVLDRDYSQEGKWSGHQLVSGVDYESLFNPLILATLTAKDQAGNTLVQDISWQEIKPIVGSTVNRYSFLKQNNAEFAAPLFNIGNIYYQIMLIIVFIALMLNIFIKIRKQHTSTIASTVGLMALLIFLTIF